MKNLILHALYFKYYVYMGEYTFYNLMYFDFQYEKKN